MSHLISKVGKWPMLIIGRVFPRGLERFSENANFHFSTILLVLFILDPTYANLSDNSGEWDHLEGNRTYNMASTASSIAQYPSQVPINPYGRVFSPQLAYPSPYTQLNFPNPAERAPVFAPQPILSWQSSYPNMYPQTYPAVYLQPAHQPPHQFPAYFHSTSIAANTFTPQLPTLSQLPYYGRFVNINPYQQAAPPQQEFIPPQAYLPTQTFLPPRAYYPPQTFFPPPAYFPRTTFPPVPTTGRFPPVVYPYQPQYPQRPSKIELPRKLLPAFTGPATPPIPPHPKFTKTLDFSRFRNADERTHHKAPEGIHQEIKSRSELIGTKPISTPTLSMKTTPFLPARETISPEINVDDKSMKKLVKDRGWWKGFNDALNSTGKNKNKHSRKKRSQKITHRYGGMKNVKAISENVVTLKVVPSLKLKESVRSESVKIFPAKNGEVSEGQHEVIIRILLPKSLQASPTVRG